MKILLVRHGRSAHVHSGWINRAEFIRWREAYETAGVELGDVPPAELRAAAAESGVVVASAARRAIESAMALAPAREIVTSPLLSELALLPPQLGRVRLPLFGWALAIGFGLLVRNGTEEQQRTRDAAQWLSELAEKEGSVVAVTHASFRSGLARELAAMGWQCDIPRRKSAHWSAWSLSRR